jgi:hypothetical protein
VPARQRADHSKRGEPAPGKELGQNRLAGQGVAESEPPCRRTQPTAAGPRKPDEGGYHPGLVLAFDHVGQQAPVETPAEHRRRSQEFPYARRRRDPSANGLGERHGTATRMNDPASSPRPSSAAHRPAPSPRATLRPRTADRRPVAPALDQRGGNGQAAQTARGDRRNLVRGQSSKLQKGNRAPSGQVVDTRQGERGLLVAKRDQAQDRLVGYVVGQILDDLNRVGVRPVQILQHEHTAGAVVHRGEHPEHGLAQHHERYLPGGSPGTRHSGISRPRIGRTEPTQGPVAVPTGAGGRTAPRQVAEEHSGCRAQQPRPISTGTRRAPASAAASRTRRDLPTPASPRTTSVVPCPWPGDRGRIAAPPTPGRDPPAPGTTAPACIEHATSARAARD